MFSAAHLSTIVTVVFCLSIVGCSESTTGQSILPTNIQLEAGDVVFRLGPSARSKIVELGDANGGYSHIGMVVSTADGLKIVHAVPDEPDFKGDVDRVKMDSISTFFRADRASKGAVMRCENKEVAKKAEVYAKDFYRRKILFDNEFDDFDTTKLYCCELVNFAFEKAGILLSAKGLHSKDLLGYTLKHYILPSEIYKSDKLKLISKF